MQSPIDGTYLLAGIIVGVLLVVVVPYATGAAYLKPTKL